MVVLMFKNMQVFQQIVARFGALLVGSNCKRGGETCCCIFLLSTSVD